MNAHTTKTPHPGETLAALLREYDVIRSQRDNRIVPDLLLERGYCLLGQDRSSMVEGKEYVMDILVCRVAWMPYYQSDDEQADGGGAYVDDGNVPHESLNFLPIDGIYYGYVKVKGRLGIQNLGAEQEDDIASDVLVAFCARNPESGDFLVVGWYGGATAYRHGTNRPDPVRLVRFTAVEATLVAESERCFRIPRANPPGNIGGIGQANVWYGLNNEAEQDNENVRVFRKRLLAYINASSTTQTPKEIKEIEEEEELVNERKQRRLSERLERRGRIRQFIHSKGYRCEACDWSIEKGERKVWGSSFELHHLTPMHELQENETRMVCAENFAVLCASCHRAIHRTEFISDVAGFAEEHLRD